MGLTPKPIVGGLDILARGRELTEPWAHWLVGAAWRMTHTYIGLHFLSHLESTKSTGNGQRVIADLDVLVVDDEDPDTCPEVYAWEVDMPVGRHGRP